LAKLERLLQRLAAEVTVMALPRIKPHMDVVSSRSEPLGMVDCIDGRNLKLARDALGQHHFLPLTWVDVIDEQVHLKRPANDVIRLWSGETFE
jgi:hypothetical protein